MIIALVANVLRIASGLQSGNYFKIAKFIEYIVENPDTTYEDTALLHALETIDSVVIDTQGGSHRIMEYLIDTSEDFHIGIAQSDIVYHMIYFQHPKKQLEIFTIAILFDEALHIIVPKSASVPQSADIRSLSRIVTLGKNSGSYYTITRILPALYAVPEELCVNKLEEILDTLTALNDPHTAGALIIAPPWDSLLSRLNQFEFISLKKSDIRVLLQSRAFRFIKKMEINENFYGDLLDHPINTVGVSALLVVNKRNLADLLGEENYPRFVRYLLTELYRMSRGELAWDSTFAQPTQKLLNDLVNKNLYTDIVVNWEPTALDFWRTHKGIEIMTIVAFSFLFTLGFIASASNRWRIRILEKLKLVRTTEGGQFVFLSEKLPRGRKRGISVNARFLNDFMGIFMLIVSFLFIGFLFLYAGRISNLTAVVKDLMIWGVIGMVLSVLFSKSVNPGALRKNGIPSLVLFAFTCGYILVLRRSNIESYLTWAALCAILVIGSVIIALNDEKLWRVFFGGVVVFALIGILSIKEITVWVVAVSFIGALIAALSLAWLLRNVRRQKGMLSEILLLLGALLLVWVWGGLFLYQIEKAQNVNFDNPIESLWSVVVYLFSGLEDRSPVTLAGRILASLVIFLGSITVLSTFTAILSSFFTERRLKEGGLVVRDYKSHIVICNWNSRGEKILKELLKSPLSDKATRFVILSTEAVPEADQLEKLDERRRITFLSGNPLSENTLEAIDIDKARAIIVLAVEGDDIKDPDAQTALIVLSVKSALKNKPGEKPIIVAEAITHKKMPLIQEAGADIVICSEDFEGGLVVQSANYPELFDVYRQLLEYSPGTNEFYMINLKDLADKNKKLFNNLLGKSFDQIMPIMHAASPEDNPTIVVGLKKVVETKGKDGKIHRDVEIYLNPKKKEWSKLTIPTDPEEAKNFSLIVMCYTRPKLEEFEAPKA